MGIGYGGGMEHQVNPMITEDGLFTNAFHDTSAMKDQTGEGIVLPF